MSEELKLKLRTKFDLHNYMSNRLNCFLPEARYCRLSFLQDILSDRKRVYQRSEIREFSFNSNYEEYSVKNAYVLLKTNTELLEYLPTAEMDQGKYPDRKFFWGLVFTTCSQWCRRYHNLVLDQRATQEKQDPNKKNKVDVADHWMKKLLQFDYNSRGGKFGKGRHSILIQQSVKPFEKREKKKVDRKIDLPFDSFQGIKRSKSNQDKQELLDLARPSLLPKEFKSSFKIDEQFETVGMRRQNQTPDKQEHKDKQLKESPGKRFTTKSLLSDLQKDPVLPSSKKRNREKFQSQGQHESDSSQASFKSTEPKFKMRKVLTLAQSDRERRSTQKFDLKNIDEEQDEENLNEDE